MRAGQLLVELESGDIAGALQGKPGGARPRPRPPTRPRRAPRCRRRPRKPNSTCRRRRTALDAQQAIYDSRQQLFTGRRDRAKGRQRRAGQPQSGAQPVRDRAQAPRRCAGLRPGTVAEGGRRAARRGERRASTRRRRSSATRRITSPIDGVVTDRPLYAGETRRSRQPARDRDGCLAGDRARARRSGAKQRS